MPDDKNTSPLSEDMVTDTDKEDQLLADLRVLWEKYRIITHEILKFIEAGSVEDFLSLTAQRQRLFEQIIASPLAESYRQTADFGKLSEELKPLDMQIIYKARTWLNKSRKQNAAVNSYDLSGVHSVGHLLNRKY